MCATILPIPWAGAPPYGEPRAELYTHAEHHVVLTVLTRGQAVLLRRYLKKIDPHAFLIVANSSEIFGKGFLQP